METRGVARLNALEADAAWQQLSRCCGATAWVATMVQARPFSDAPSLLAACEAAFATLTPADWREAFAHHPRIGDLDSLRAKFAATRDWAGVEQAAVNAAAEAVLAALAAGNRRYEEKFGYIFIICATGKSAAAMLEALHERLHNEPAVELLISAGQQEQITVLRLKKLLNAWAHES